MTQLQISWSYDWEKSSCGDENFMRKWSLTENQSEKVKHWDAVRRFSHVARAVQPRCPEEEMVTVLTNLCVMIKLLENLGLNNLTGSCIIQPCPLQWLPELLAEPVAWPKGSSQIQTYWGRRAASHLLPPASSLILAEKSDKHQCCDLLWPTWYYISILLV